MLEHVAASQTAQVLGGTGESGDYLSHLIIAPTSGSPGAVTLTDGSLTPITVFDGGTDSVQSLIPFPVHIGDESRTGPWKVTTGANVRVIAVGYFSG
jgi:hypothetical protein